MWAYGESSSSVGLKWNLNFTTCTCEPFKQSIIAMIFMGRTRAGGWGPGEYKQRKWGKDSKIRPANQTVQTSTHEIRPEVSLPSITPISDYLHQSHNRSHQKSLQYSIACGFVSSYFVVEVDLAESPGFKVPGSLISR